MTTAACDRCDQIKQDVMTVRVGDGVMALCGECRAELEVRT